VNERSQNVLNRFRRRRTARRRPLSGEPSGEPWEPEWEALPGGHLGLRKDGRLVGAIELLEDGRTQLHTFEGADPTAWMHLVTKLGELEGDEASDEP